MSTEKINEKERDYYIWDDSREDQIKYYSDIIHRGPKAHYEFQEIPILDLDFMNLVINDLISRGWVQGVDKSITRIDPKDGQITPLEGYDAEVNSNQTWDILSDGGSAWVKPGDEYVALMANPRSKQSDALCVFSQAKKKFFCGNPEEVGQRVDEIDVPYLAERETQEVPKREVVAETIPESTEDQNQTDAKDGEEINEAIAKKFEIQSNKLNKRLMKLKFEALLRDAMENLDPNSDTLEVAGLFRLNKTANGYEYGGSLSVDQWVEIFTQDGKEANRQDVIDLRAEFISVVERFNSSSQNPKASLQKLYAQFGQVREVSVAAKAGE